MRRKREPIRESRSQVLGTTRSQSSRFRDNSAGHPRPRATRDQPRASNSCINNTNDYLLGINNNNNHNNNPLTISDAYQGNLLLYNFFAKHSQRVFLERNITRILTDQARLLKAENEGRKGSRKYWNRDGKTRKMSEIVRRLGVVPEIDDQVAFGLKIQVPREFPIVGSRPCECDVKLFALPSPSSGASSRYLSLESSPNQDPSLEIWTEAVKMVSRNNLDGGSQQIFGTKKPFVIPLSAFAIDDDDGRTFAPSGYEIRCRIRLGQGDDQVDSIEDTGAEESYETCLQFDENLVCNGGLKEATVAAAKVGEADPDSNPASEALQLKLTMGWNKSINYQVIKRGGNKKQRQQQQHMSNAALPSKRRKQIRIDYTFRGHVKDFDEHDAHKNPYLSMVNLNNKLYAFCYQGPTYTCVICKNTTFRSLDRLRFHLLHTHTYFAYSLEGDGKHKDVVKIMVEPAVAEGRRFSRPPGNNDRKFLWIRPKGVGDRAFNLEEYLKGDTTWARGVVIPEAERKLMNAPGRMLKKMQVVPDLNFEVEKRRCVVPARQDGKGYVRFLTGEAVAAGDDLSESDDEIDESWVTTKVNEKIEASGFSAAGREFLKLWGAHVMVEGPRSNRHLHDCLIRFCRQNKKTLKSSSLRQEFDRFVVALRSRGQIDKFLVKDCKKILDSTGV
ncbi:hypothetical protein TWF718_004236 [Orbilia javanica]|uniref:Polycomb protein VEFS-Box domain-containing protein n=1 Tax=Orbilia javanica TaxID=47235 RepID=A0AAN8MS07_9PEZI